MLSPCYCQPLDQLDYSISHKMPNDYIPENIENLGWAGLGWAGMLGWDAGLGCWAGMQSQKNFYQRTPKHFEEKKILAASNAIFFYRIAGSRYSCYPLPLANGNRVIVPSVYRCAVGIAVSLCRQKICAVFALVRSRTNRLMDFLASREAYQHRRHANPAMACAVPRY